MVACAFVVVVASAESANAIVLRPSVSAEPSEQTLSLPGSATMTATVFSTYDGYQPWASERVHFQVSSGPHQGVSGLCSVPDPQSAQGRLSHKR